MSRVGRASRVATGEDRPRAPVLVLGLGNILLADDGVGITLLHRLEAIVDDGGDVELLDGGTQGLALLPWVSARRALLILDAIALGAAPGTIHDVDDPRRFTTPGGTTAHECNAASLLAALDLLGECPMRVRVVGIEPAELVTRMRLSEPVEASVPAAVLRAERALTSLRSGLTEEVMPCTN